MILFRLALFKNQCIRVGGGGGGVCRYVSVCLCLCVSLCLPVSACMCCVSSYGFVVVAGGGGDILLGLY